MTWMGSGEKTSTVKLTGPYGGRLRIGRFIVPKHVFFTITGSGGDPDLHAHFEWRDDRPQTVELRIVSKPDGRGLRPADLDALDLDGIARVTYREHTRIVEREGDGVVVEAVPDWSDERHERDRWELDGRISDALAAPGRGRSRAELQLVAEVYSEHKGKAALLAVAAALEVSQRTAARRIADARAAGLLPPRGRD